jgi:glycogen synthase
VIDEAGNPGRGTGFSFEGPSVAGLVAACERAIALREAGGADWDGLLDRAMAVDFDWTAGPAPRYLDAYRRAISIRTGG